MENTEKKEDQNSNSEKTRLQDGKLQKQVFTPYITVKGKRIYHPKGGLYVFWADVK